MLKVNSNSLIVNRKKMKQEKGFSLIELIVVITIIAVITVIGVVNFSGTNAKARDGRRMGDLEKMRIALEIVRQVGSTYPGGTGNPTTRLSGLVPNYLQSVPVDPKSLTYSYYYNGTGVFSYTLDAHMEDVGSTNGAYGSNCGGTCNYRVTSP